MNGSDNEYIREEKEYRRSEISSNEAAETDVDLEEFFSVHLQPGEKILWSGATEPDADLRARGGTYGSIGGLIFGIVFASAMIIACLIGKSFIGAGLLSPFLIVPAMLLKKELRHEKYRYAITDRRVLGHDGRELFSLNVGKIRSTYVDHGKNGIGKVLFNQREVEKLHRSMETGSSYEKRVIVNDGGFFGIREPQKAADIIRRASERAREKELQAERLRR